MKSGKFNNSLLVNSAAAAGKPSADPKIAPTSPLLTQALKAPAVDLFKLLQTGQTLSATVIKQLSSQNILQIKIGSTVLNAQTDLKLPAGTPIKLEVISLVPNKLPELRLTSLLPDKPQIISQAFKQALPRQITLPSFINQLKSLLSGRQTSSNVPKQVELLARQIIAETPSKGELQQPNLFRKNVLQSGIFLEKQLTVAQAAGNPLAPVVRGDQKAKLLTLLNALQTLTKQPSPKQAPSTLSTPTTVPGAKTVTPPSQPASTVGAADLILKNILPKSPIAPVNPQETLVPQIASELKELIGKTEGAIAKIVLDQLASLPKEEAGKQSWQLELPFHNSATQTDSLKLTITQEDNNSSPEAEATWSVVLEITPPGLGTVYSKIVIRGDQVDSYFWSEDTATCDLIDSHLGDLEKRFSAAGLETGQLGTRNGKPVEANAKKPENQLVSERA